ncbi:PREDICTED: protein brambleberry-like [Amphimedon queenslandica]|uniref:Protein brambleberry n=1 Tax=Amphimedon queenslandica TaxID=400682 RepID=A0A1X7TMQ3_AMPQE|nr:PREDICTED: protein brambleberry-like [Amphimedon queenslandica]|eukprot:XP_011407209.2 PREDICTED: protein brambleberry-like [Amphimedon queenslandica]
MQLSLIITIFLFLGQTRSWWPFSEEEERKKEDLGPGHKPQVEFDEETVRLARFESVSLQIEQKFLDEAKQLLGVSPLQKCQHRVMMLLNNTCHDMDDEEHAKLSVRLMNCQSQAEGRPTFKCTEEMSIADCTRGMDPDTWTTYHIISNRARALCYVRAQQQFRIQTELVVNRLKSVTLQHLKDAESLAQINEKLREETNDALTDLKRGQVDILEHQTNIKTSQEVLNSFMQGNINTVSGMGTLLKKRSEELQNVTDKLHKHIDLAHSKSVQQEKERLKLQEATIKELDKLNKNVKEVWNGIDSVTQDLFMKFKELTSYHQRVMTNMEEMNTSISNLLILINTMNTGLTDKLSYLNDTVGGTQGSLHVVISIASHLSFFLFCVLVSLFLRLPFKPRLCLFVLIISNLMIDVKFMVGLSFMELVWTLVAVIIGYYGYQRLHPFKINLRQQPKSLPQKQQPSPNLPPPLHHNDIIDDDELSDDSSETPLPSFPPPSSPLRPAVTLTPQRFSSVGSHRNMKCSSLTRSGLPCQLNALPPSPYCHRHKRAN